MALSYEELTGSRSYLERVAQQQKAVQLKQNQAEALKVSNLIADPNWEIWCRHVEKTKRDNDALLERLKNEILNTPVNSPGFPMLQIDYHKTLAFGKGVEFGLQAAKTIVEQGERALEQLKLLEG